MRIGRSFPVQGAYRTMHGAGIPVLEFVPAPFADPVVTQIAVTTVSLKRRDQRRRVERSLPGPTMVLTPAPVLLPIETELLAIRTRRELPRRALSLNLEPSAGGVNRSFGPFQPIVVRPAPTIQMQTIRVALASRRVPVERQRMRPTSRLSAPAVLAVTRVPRNLEVELASMLRRSLDARLKPMHELLAPTVLALPPPVAVAVKTALAAVASRGLLRTRGTQRALGAPTVVNVQAPVLYPPRVATVRARPRKTLSALRAAPVVGAAAAPLARPVQTSLARARLQRSAHLLRQPSALQPVATKVTVALVRIRPAGAHPKLLSTPATVAAVQTVARSAAHLAASRRPAIRSRLRPPVVVAAAAAFVARPVTVALAVTARELLRTRGTQRSLGAPVLVATAAAFVPAPVKVTAVAARPRRTRYLLAAPTVVAAPAAAFVAHPVKATLSAYTPRRTRSVIAAPAVTTAPVALARPMVVVLSAVQTRAGSQRRGTQRALGNPAAISTTAAPVFAPLKVALAARVRASVRSSLAAPATLASTQTVVVKPNRSLASARRPSVLSRLRRPAVVAPQPLVKVERVKAWTVAGTDRSARSRRRVFRHLSAPVLINPGGPTGGPPVAPIQVNLQHRRVDWRYYVLRILWGPSVLNPPPLARPIAVSLAERVRVVAPFRFARTAPLVTRPQPVLYPVKTALATRRRDNKRREAAYRLRRPVVVAAPSNFVNRPLGVTLIPRRVDKRTQVQHFLLPPGAVASPAQPNLKQQTIAVSLTARQRADLVRRAVHSRLPVVIGQPAQTFAPIQVQRTPRRNDWQRYVLHIFFGPAVVAPRAAPNLEQQTVAVTLAGRTRAEAQRRAPRSRLRPFQAITPRAPTLDQQTVAVAAVTTRPRLVRALLGAPVTTRAAFGEIAVALARTRPRSTQATVAPPTVLAPVATRVLVALAKTTRRATSYELFRAVLTPITARVTVRTSAVAASRPRRVLAALRRPIVVAPTALPRERTIRAVFRAAVDDRTGRIRKLPHSKITPPFVIHRKRNQHFKTFPMTDHWNAGDMTGHWTAGHITEHLAADGDLDNNTA